MSPRKILVAAVALAIMVVPTVAQGATIRVTAENAPQLGNLEWEAGSARAYVDSSGKAHALKRNTALGQLIAATAFTDTRLGIFQYSFGPFVTRIGNRGAKATSGWLFFVNGAPAKVGAADQILKPRDRVLWMFDRNTSKAGPFALDVQTELGNGGTVVSTVRKIGGKKPVAAAGATILIDGIAVGTTDAKGQYTHTLPTDPATGLPTDWDVLQATLAGTIPSQFVEE